MLSRLSFVLLTLLVLIAITSCSGGDHHEVTRIDLSSLVLGPNQWEGKQVEVQGTLIRLMDPDGTTYGVIQDTEESRIGLKQIAPWSTLIGNSVDAMGTVEFDPSFGWYLKDPTVHALPGS